MCLCVGGDSACRAPLFGWVTAVYTPKWGGGVSLDSRSFSNLKVCFEGPCSGYQRTMGFSYQSLRKREIKDIACQPAWEPEDRDDISSGIVPRHRAWLRIHKWMKPILHFKTWFISCITSVPSVPLARWYQTGARVANGPLLSNPWMSYIIVSIPLFSLLAEN